MAEKLSRLRVRLVLTPFDIEELLGLMAEVVAARHAAQDTGAEHPGRE